MLPILIVVLIFLLGIYIAHKLFRSIIYKLISAVVLLAIAFLSYTALTNHITNPVDLVKTVTNKKSSDAPAPKGDILQSLMNYTDKSSAGPTQNYYWKDGQAQLANDSDIPVGGIKFSEDTQGRSGVARAKLTYDLYEDSRGGRQGTPLNPLNGGWPAHNFKTSIHYGLTGRTYNGYFYNRSHSIADSLASSSSYLSADNFTAGTRPQNVGADQHGGMRAAEEIAEKYWKAHPRSNAVIQYQTTPVYNGNEKIPRGSIVDEKSSDGEINIRIIVINSAEGFHINYNNGQATK